MAKARHGDRRRMELYKELRELAQDHEAAIYMVAILTTELSTDRLGEVLEGARMAAAKLPFGSD
jgi:hypothetical protein